MRTSADVELAVSLPNQHGCCQVGEDFVQTVRELSETTELIGAEHLFAKHTVSKKVGDRLLAIVEGSESINQARERLLGWCVKMINGELTKAESLKHRESGIYKKSPTF